MRYKSNREDKKYCEMVYVVSETTLLDGKSDFRILGVYLDEKVAGDIIIKKMSEKREEWKELLEKNEHSLFYGRPYGESFQEFKYPPIDSSGLFGIYDNSNPRREYKFKYDCFKQSFLIYTDEPLKHGDDILVIHSVKKHYDFNNLSFEVQDVVIDKNNVPDIANSVIEKFKSYQRVHIPWVSENDENKFSCHLTDDFKVDAYCDVFVNTFKIDATEIKKLDKHKNISVNKLNKMFPGFLWKIIYEKYFKNIDLWNPETYQMVNVHGDLTDHVYQDWIVDLYQLNEMYAPLEDEYVSYNIDDIVWRKTLDLSVDSEHEFDIVEFSLMFRGFIYFAVGDDLCGYNEKTQQYVHVRDALLPSEIDSWSYTVYQLDGENPFEDKLRCYGQDRILVSRIFSNGKEQ